MADGWSIAHEATAVPAPLAAAKSQVSFAAETVEHALSAKSEDALERASKEHTLARSDRSMSGNI